MNVPIPDSTITQLEDAVGAALNAALDAAALEPSLANLLRFAGHHLIRQAEGLAVELTESVGGELGKSPAAHADAPPKAEQLAAAEQRAETERARADAAISSLAVVRWKLARSLNASSVDGSAAAAWRPFEALLSSETMALADASGGDKLIMPAEYFAFGETRAFMDGLPGMLEGGLLRSMVEEARENDGGRWWAEFAYVVEQTAVEDVDLPTTAKFQGKRSVSGEKIVRDRGHGGMTLADFCAHEMAQSAGLTPAEVAAIRLYSGPMFAPINLALRTTAIGDWGTTIACCYSGVLKLSFCSQPARVYRGVREEDRQLPPAFLSREEGKFAGGVERAFMSTTKSPAVALDYSGGVATAGSIFVIDFDMNSRGASIQWLSQYPHEEELLFPPCTGLTCLDVSQHGRKRCVRVSAQVSTARLDTREVETPDHVPGTREAMRFVGERLVKTAVELAQMQKWNLKGTHLGVLEHAAMAALLLGRAQRSVSVTEVDLQDCALGADGVRAIAEAVKSNPSITAVTLDAQGTLPIKQLKGIEPVQVLNFTSQGLGVASAVMIASLIGVNSSVTECNLRDNGLGVEGWTIIFNALRDSPMSKIISWDLSGEKLGPGIAKLLADYISVTPSLTSLSLGDNQLGDDGVQALSIGLKESKSLTMLDLSNRFSSSTTFGPKGAAALASAIGVMASLTELNLSDNRLCGVWMDYSRFDRGEQKGNYTAEGINAIADALRVCASMTRLDVRNNWLGDDCKAVLGKAIEGRSGVELAL